MNSRLAIKFICFLGFMLGQPVLCKTESKTNRKSASLEACLPVNYLAQDGSLRFIVEGDYGFLQNRFLATAKIVSSQLSTDPNETSHYKRKTSNGEIDVVLIGLKNADRKILSASVVLYPNTVQSLLKMALDPNTIPCVKGFGIDGLINANKTLAGTFLILLEGSRDPSPNIL